MRTPTAETAASMEYSSSASDVWNNVTTSPSDHDDDDDLKLYLAHIRDVALRVVYIIIGTLGVVDNLFVLAIFFMFVKITAKVMTISTIRHHLSSKLQLPRGCSVSLLT